MNEKVQLKVYIPLNLSLNLRVLIQNKYSKYEKGLLSYEVEQAIRSWIALHTQAQLPLDAKPPNPIPKVASVFMQVKEYLLHKYFDELKVGQQIPRRFLDEAIEAIRGSDKRTIEKWLRSFEKFHLAKPISSAAWEIL